MDLTVPPMPNNVSDEPLELGTLTAEPYGPLAVGDDASTLKLVGLDEKQISLWDFKGKVVVVNVWTVYGREYLPRRELLNEIWEAHGKNGEVAMLGVCTGPLTYAKAYVEARPMPWMQTVTGRDAAGSAAQSRLPQGDMKTGSGVWVIGKDGKVAAVQVPADKVKEEVEKAMK